MQLSAFASGRIVAEMVLCAALLCLLVVPLVSAVVGTESLSETITGSASEEATASLTLSEPGLTRSASLSDEGSSTTITDSLPAATKSESETTDFTTTVSGGSPTLTLSSSLTASASLAPTLTPTRTFSTSMSDEGTPSTSQSLILTASASLSDELTPTATITPPPTRTPTFTLSATTVASVSPTDSRTPPETKSASLSGTRTPPPTPTRTYSSSFTSESTMTTSTTAEMTATATSTDELTGSETQTLTVGTLSLPQTLTRTLVATETATSTLSTTVTDEFTATDSSSVSIALTWTMQPTDTATASLTPTMMTEEETQSGSGTVTLSNEATSTMSASLSTSKQPVSLTAATTRTGSIVVTATTSSTLSGSASATDERSATASAALPYTVTDTPGTSSGTTSRSETASASSPASASSSLSISTSPSVSDEATSSVSLLVSLSATGSASLSLTVTPTEPLTLTPGPTFTFAPTLTSSTSATASVLLSASSSSSASDEPTLSSTVAVTPTATTSASLIPSRSISATVTATHVASRTASVSASPTPTASLSSKSSATCTTSLSEELLATRTQSASASSTPSLSASSPRTGTRTPSSTPPPTATPSQSASSSVSLSISQTASGTITPPPTPTPSHSLSTTMSFTASLSSETTTTVSRTGSASVTLSASLSASRTEQTATATSLPTDSLTFVPTMTWKLTVTPTATASTTSEATVSASRSFSGSPSATQLTATVSTTGRLSLSDSPSESGTGKTGSLSFSSEASLSKSGSASDEPTSSETISPPPTPTRTFSNTRVPPPTPSASPTDDGTASLSVNATATVSLAPSTSLTITATPTQVVTSTESLTLTLTDTMSLTIESTESETLTNEATPSETSTNTRHLTDTETLESTPSSTRTLTITPPPTPTLSHSTTAEGTASRSVTLTASVTATITPPPTPTPTASATRSTSVTATFGTMTRRATETVHSFTTTRTLTLLPTRTASSSASRPTLELVFPRYPRREGGPLDDPFHDSAASQQQQASDPHFYMPKIFGDAIRRGGPREFRSVAFRATGDLFDVERAASTGDGIVGGYFHKRIAVDVTQAPTMATRRWKVFSAESIAVNATMLTITFNGDAAYTSQRVEVITITLDREVLAMRIEPVAKSFHVAILPTTVAIPDAGAHTPAAGELTKPPLPQGGANEPTKKATVAVTGGVVAAASSVVGFASAGHVSRVAASASIATCAGVFTELTFLEHPTRLSIKVSDEPNSEQVAHFLGAVVMNFVLCACILLAHFAAAAIYYLHGRSNIAPGGQRPLLLLSLSLTAAMRSLQFPSKALFVFILFPASVKASVAVLFFSIDAGSLALAFVGLLPWIAACIAAAFLLLNPPFSARFIERDQQPASTSGGRATTTWRAQSPRRLHDSGFWLPRRQSEGVVVGADFEDPDPPFDANEAMDASYDESTAATSSVAATARGGSVDGGVRALARRYLLPRGEWIDADTSHISGFTGHFGALFDDYRAPHSHFQLIDMTVSAAVGGLDGYAVATRKCSASAGALLLVSILFLAALVWKRPYNIRANNPFFIAVVAVQVLLAALAVRSTLARDDTDTYKALEGCSLWLEYMLVVKTLIDVATAAYAAFCDPQDPRGSTAGSDVGKRFIVAEHHPVAQPQTASSASSSSGFAGLAAVDELDRRSAMQPQGVTAAAFSQPPVPTRVRSAIAAADAIHSPFDAAAAQRSSPQRLTDTLGAPAEAALGASSAGPFAVSINDMAPPAVGSPAGNWWGPLGATVAALLNVPQLQHPAAPSLGEPRTVASEHFALAVHDAGRLGSPPQVAAPPAMLRDTSLAERRANPFADNPFATFGAQPSPSTGSAAFSLEDLL